MCFNKEDKMSTVQEKLNIANKNIDSVVDDLWAKGSENLKRLEVDYNKRLEGGKEE